jgi:nitroreductase
VSGCGDPVRHETGEELIVMEHQSLTDEDFLAAVELAIRAPSLHNSQPWRFRRSGDTVEVMTDPARQLPIADRTGREARIACGAAILNLRLAFAIQGHPAQVSLVPELHEPGLLARLTPGPPRPASPEEAALAAAIPKRHSNRAPFVDAPVPPTHRDALIAAAKAESAVLTFITDRHKVAEVAELISTANATLAAQPAYKEEVRAWIRTDATADDGISRGAAGPAPAPHELLARRDFGGAPAPEHRRYEAEPLLAVLGSLGDSRREQLVAGQALQRVLLTATRLGLAVSIISQPIEVPETFEQLSKQVGLAAVPQLLLRIGFGVRGSITRRRSPEAVIDSAAHST